MDCVKMQDSRRLMKAEISSKRIPTYKDCPKCVRMNEFREQKGTPSNPINYKGTRTCKWCGKESTIANWYGVDSEDL